MGPDLIVPKLSLLSCQPLLCKFILCIVNSDISHMYPLRMWNVGEWRKIGCWIFEYLTKFWVAATLESAVAPAVSHQRTDLLYLSYTTSTSTLYLLLCMWGICILYVSHKLTGSPGALNSSWIVLWVFSECSLSVLWVPQTSLRHAPDTP